jgi:excisionase family DNA binding protein
VGKAKTQPQIERLALSVPEALRAMGIGRTRFYDEVGAGRIRIVKSGRRTLVPVSSLREFMEP